QKEKIERNDKSGSTSLIWAVRNGRPRLVQELIREGALLERKENDGHAALLLAIQYGYTTIAEMLRGVEVSKRKGTRT
ncbi:hypothetical protein BKA67DRAFT_567096, partial [Truncatella angustata]